VGTRARHLSGLALQEVIDIRLGGAGLGRPIETALNPGAIWLCQSPELAFGYHGHSGEHDASILESLQPQRFARIPLAEGYLAASAYCLDFGDMGIDFCIHAIMLSCLHVAGELLFRHPQGM
jgi:hypothetical protein